MDISNAVNSSKFKYLDPLAEKFNDPKMAAETFWWILKTFVNGSNIPLIFWNWKKKKKELFTFDFSTDDILKFIKTFDLNKAHVHDVISFMTRLYTFFNIKIFANFFKKLFSFSCLEKEWPPVNGRIQVLFLLTRKEISTWLIIINQHL